jgi:hypothetical protein
MSTVESRATEDIVWGAGEIRQVVRVDARRTYYLLERGLLPAKKNRSGLGRLAPQAARPRHRRARKGGRVT